MSDIIQEMQQQLEKLNFVLRQCEMPEMRSVFETRILAIQIRGQIDLLEKRIEQMKKIPNRSQLKPCGLCQTNRVEEELVQFETPVDGGKAEMFICIQCQSTIEKVMTTNEAENRWNLPKGTIKADIAAKRLTKYQSTGLITKSGKFWLIHEIVMINHYGNKYLSDELENECKGELLM